MIGEAAIDLRWLIVGGDSFDHPEFFETGFKNFGRSLKVFTLKNGCFENSLDYEDDIHGAYVNSLDTFFKSLSENCPNLSILNLGCVDELGGCESNVEFERFFMAGFENVKELNEPLRVSSTRRTSSGLELIVTTSSPPESSLSV